MELYAAAFLRNIFTALGCAPRSLRQDTLAASSSVTHAELYLELSIYASAQQLRSLPAAPLAPSAALYAEIHRDLCMLTFSHHIFDALSDAPSLPPLPELLLRRHEGHLQNFPARP